TVRRNIPPRDGPRALVAHPGRAGDRRRAAPRAPAEHDPVRGGGACARRISGGLRTDPRRTPWLCAPRRRRDAAHLVRATAERARRRQVTAIIQTEKLTKSYGSHRGIVEVDLEIQEGEV